MDDTYLTIEYSRFPSRISVVGVFRPEIGSGNIQLNREQNAIGFLTTIYGTFIVSIITSESELTAEESFARLKTFLTVMKMLPSQDSTIVSLPSQETSVHLFISIPGFIPAFSSKTISLTAGEENITRIPISHFEHSRKVGVLYCFLLFLPTKLPR